MGIISRTIINSSNNHNNQISNKESTINILLNNSKLNRWIRTTTAIISTMIDKVKFKLKGLNNNLTCKKILIISINSSSNNLT